CGPTAPRRPPPMSKAPVPPITKAWRRRLGSPGPPNPATGRRWRSVYTPDLVAVGEGPASWTEFFGQQTRWSAGTFDAVLRQFWRVGLKLRPGAMMHYFMMLTYYPSVAVGWLLRIPLSPL